MKLRRVTQALMALWGKRRLDRELDEEITAHLELAERDALARGLSREDARRAALVAFGGVEQVKEEHRERRGVPVMETLLRDLRYGLAALVRAPGFAVLVAGVLGLGIGGSVAMFSVVDAVLLKPLPFPDPDRIMSVWEAPKPGSVNATTVPDFLEWKRLGTVFEALSAENSIRAALYAGGEPTRLTGKAVTSDYFRVFATGAQLGRTFAEGEDQPGADDVIVLSNAAWQNHFGGDPNVLHRRIQLDGKSHEVIGVLRPGAFDRDGTQFWKPLAFTPEEKVREIHWLTVYGRLRADVSLAQARERMEAIHAALVDTAAIENREEAIVVQPLSRLLVGPALERSITIAFGAVALVLLIACANAANLLLVKGAARRKEMAVRAALGASRGRLAAQLLTESIVLCACGGAAGVLIANLLIRAAGPALSQALPFTSEVTVDYRVLGFAAAVSLGAGLLAGVLPAFQSSFGHLADSLNRIARGSSGTHAGVRRGIVVGEVALSLVLVCGAFLLFRSLLKLQQLDTGVRIENVVTMSMDLPEGAYPTAQKAAMFYGAVAERLRGVPGVEEAGLATQLPLEWISNGEAMRVTGAERLIRLRFKRVDAGYFKTLGIPVLAGRGITDEDREGTPRIVVINEALAARLAESAGISDPVGRRVRVSSPGYIEKDSSMPEVEIAGVIRSERVASPGAPDPPVAYVPLAQVPAAHVKLIVRGHDETTSLVPRIREAVREIDPRLPLADVASMQEVRERRLAGASRPAWVIGALAAVAVLLAGIGLYGVISHAVAQQRREIGIRMALGARSGDVLSQVLRNALMLVGTGLLFGIGGAVALTRVLNNLLYEVSPLDPFALAGACASMLVIGLFAGCVPARRAARVDPAATLRDEG